MKSILTHGGFHDPNRPRSVDDYVGLRLSVHMDYEYKTDKNGKPLLDKDGNKDRLTVHGYYLSSAAGPQMVAMNGGAAWTLYPCERGECPW